MKRVLLLALLIAGCGGGNAPAPTPEPPPPPPPPPVTCTHTVTWVNPTHDTDENPLGAADLIAATLYAVLIPYVPEEWERIYSFDAYVLKWEIRDVAAGTWHYELTVSNSAGESEPLTVDKECS